MSHSLSTICCRQTIIAVYLSLISNITSDQMYWFHSRNQFYRPWEGPCGRIGTDAVDPNPSFHYQTWLLHMWSQDYPSILAANVIWVLRSSSQMSCRGGKSFWCILPSMRTASQATSRGRLLVTRGGRAQTGNQTTRLCNKDWSRTFRETRRISRGQSYQSQGIAEKHWSK